MNQRRAAVFFPLFIVFVFLFSRVIGCASQSEDPGLLDSDASVNHVSTGAGSCSSPAEGCSCSVVGSTAACGRVDLIRDGFNQCSYGAYTCTDAGTWSACEGAIHVQAKLGKPGRTAQDLQLDASSCGDADPCDPYCSGYTDTPVGISPLPSGLTLADGGLTVVPASDGGVVPGTIQTTSTGVSSCGAMMNVGVGGCSAPGPTACQQDFRCDTDSHTCVWNGGQGYHDPSVDGGDLTIGAACSFASTSTFPVCNRGSSTIPEGAAINVNFVPGTTPPNGCTVIAAPPTCSSVAPTGGLVPGACLNVPCSIPGGGGFAVVNAGDPGNLEGAGWCGNNVAFAETDVSAGDAAATCATCTYCDTLVTGVVDDPGNNVGLRDITVYELAGTSGVVPALVDNDGGTTPPPCDTCDSLLDAGTYSVATNTGNLGDFTLHDVTPGPHQKIVAQTGRWRRTDTVNIPACATTTLNNDDIRLPRKQSEGDIPKTAFVMGEAESLECWMLKMGIDPSEMTPYTGPGDTQRIQLFSEAPMTPGGGGMVYGGPHPLLNADAHLWSPGGALNEYSAVVLSCDGTDLPETSAAMTAMVNYANAGGRVFMDHWWGASWLVENGSPWNTSAVSTWSSPFEASLPYYVDFYGNAYYWPAWGKVQNSTTPQQHMNDWLNQWAMVDPPGAGFIVSNNPRRDARTQGSASTVWVRGDSHENFGGPGGTPSFHHHSDGNYTISFSFETPVGSSPTCGRVLFNGMHASQTRSPLIGAGTFAAVTGTFPTDCDRTTPLTSEETALEYQLFQVTSCALGGRPPPPPPPPPPALSSTTFTRDFYASCPDGTKLVWQAFNWEANLPTGTSIQYYAASAPTNPDGGAPSFPPGVTAAPATVPIGTATLTTLAPQWGTDDHTVDWHLQNEPPGPPQTSQNWLRVYMVFEPTATMAPTLYDWQQLYDCVPDQ